MSAMRVQTQAIGPVTATELGREIATWVKKNVPLTVLTAVIAGGFSYVTNLLLMVFWYDGYQKTADGAATGPGNFISGGLFWGIGSSVVFGLFGYWRAVGNQRFWKDLANFPSVISGIFRQDGKASRIHLLWGAALSLLAAQIVSPWLGAAVAFALVASAPSLLGRILSSLLFRVWSTLVNRLAPTRQNPISGMMSMTVGILGSAAALLLGFFITGAVVKLVLAVLCAGAALLLAGQNKPAARLPLWILLSLAAVYLFDLLQPLIALAHDGGFKENGGDLGRLIQSGAAIPLLASSTVGATTAGVGAPVGTAIGSVLGTTSDRPPGNAPQPEPPPPVQDPVNAPPPVAETKPVAPQIPVTDGQSGGDAGQDQGQQPADGESEPADTTDDEEAQPPAGEDGGEGPDLDALKAERERLRQQLLGIAQNLLAGVEDPERRGFYEGFLNRNSDDPDKLRSAIDAIRTQMSAAGDQAASDAEWWKGFQKTAEDIRDWSLRANRALAWFVPGGDKVVAVQQGLYAGAKGYEEGGWQGAAGRAAAAGLDNVTGGMATPLYNSGGDIGQAIDERLKQYNPEEYWKRLAEVKAQAEEGNLGDALGKAVDAAEDAADAAKDLKHKGEAVGKRLKGEPGSPNEPQGRQGGEGEEPPTGRGDDEAAQRKAQEEAEARRQAEEEARKQAEEEARRKAEEEAEARRQEEEAKRKADEEEAKRKAEEEEAKRKAEEEEARRKAEEEAEAQRKAEEEARQREEEERKRQEEEDRRKAEEEEEAKRKADEEEAKRKAEEEEAKRKAEEEAEAQKKAEEDEARRKAEEEAEAQRKAEEEAEAKRKAEEEEAKRQEEEGRKRQQEEDEIRKRLKAKAEQTAQQVNVEPIDPIQHFADVPGLMGEHASIDLGGNPNNPQGDIPQKPYKCNSGTVLTDPFEAALARHTEAKPKDTPFKSFTSTYEKASRFNAHEVAQVDIPESQLNNMMANQEAGKAPYGKMGNTQYMGENEMCIKKVPMENWKMITEKPVAGPKMTEQTQGPLTGYSYYINANWEKVYRLYRGLTSQDLP